MKKICLLIVAAAMLLLPSASFAQNMNGDQELSLSYGRKSGTEILKWFRSSPPSRDYGTYNVKASTTGNMFVTYRYFFTDIFSLGLALGTESFSYDSYRNENPNGGLLVAHYNVNVSTLAIEPRVLYYNGKRLRLYGFGALGVRLYQQTSSPQEPFNGIGGKVFINSQVTPFGIYYGNKFAGFAEIGMGYKGLINVGASYRIARKHPAKETEKK